MARYLATYQTTEDTAVVVFTTTARPDTRAFTSAAMDVAAEHARPLPITLLDVERLTPVGEW